MSSSTLFHTASSDSYEAGQLERGRDHVARREVPLAGDGDRLGDRERREQQRVLERATERAVGSLVRRPFGDVDARAAGCARVDLEEPGDAVHQRGLAGAVVADEPEDLPALELEVDVVDGGDAAEALDDAGALEHDLGVFGDHPLLGHRRGLVDVGAVDFLRGVRRVRAGDEDRAQDVGALEQLGRLPFEAHRALLHEHRALGEVQRDVDRLLDDDDRRAAAVDLADHLEQLRDDRRRQAERQLVDHQQLRPRHQRAAEGEHLLLAAGQVAGHLARARLEDREERLDLGLGGFDAPGRCG